MVFVELGNCGFESELAAGNLQSLNEICRAGEQHKISLTEGPVRSGNEVAYYNGLFAVCWVRIQVPHRPRADESLLISAL